MDGNTNYETVDWNFYKIWSSILQLRTENCLITECQAELILCRLRFEPLLSLFGLDLNRMSQLKLTLFHLKVSSSNRRLQEFGDEKTLACFAFVIIN